MPNQVRALRSSTSQNRPTGRLPGELYVNFADNQLGTINPANTATDLIAVRYFSPTANYFIGDHVIYLGILYRALAPSNPGPFVQANWSLIGGAVTVADTPPANPQSGQLWFDSVGGQLYVFYSDATSSQWVIAVNIPPGSSGGGGTSVTIGDIAPPSPTAGSLWWNSAEGQLYIWYNDGNSAQWVPSTNQMGGGYLLLTGGSLTGPLILAADPTLALGAATKQYADTKFPLVGISNGSEAIPGQVGEVLSTVQTTGVAMATGSSSNLAAITLTPGDWDVFGEIWFAGSMAGGTVLNGCITPVSGTFPTAPAMNSSRFQLFFAPGGLSATQQALCPCRANVTVAAPYYLVASLNYTTGSAVVYGKIWARRIR
jgi:hypothetical protein